MCTASLFSPPKPSYMSPPSRVATAPAPQQKRAAKKRSPQDSATMEYAKRRAAETSGRGGRPTILSGLRGDTTPIQYTRARNRQRY